MRPITIQDYGETRDRLKEHSKEVKQVAVKIGQVSRYISNIVWDVWETTEVNVTLNIS
jgi:hypothetical protein